ncbi:hypothetical protein G5V59_22375 [Nocardioides sp. W3-2-3]|uniref:hypothetical protein n=1 Tax=Nocardioides convexus TaxID=2712224 RepID=UPI0024187573|nr:hypothetical protein [Nocardioides convexus]NHA01592.1 hypothetical protein [Nocardioides convexus]
MTVGPPLVPTRRRALDGLVAALARDDGPRLVLVTAPPGGGLSTFLRALAGAVPDDRRLLALPWEDALGEVDASGTVVLEDAQHADAAAVQALVSASRRGEVVVVLGWALPGDGLFDSVRAAADEVVALGGLDAEDVAALAEQRGVVLPASQADRLLRHTGGRARYVAEPARGRSGRGLDGALVRPARAGDRRSGGADRARRAVGGDLPAGAGDRGAGDRGPARACRRGRGRRPDRRGGPGHGSGRRGRCGRPADSARRARRMGPAGRPGGPPCAARRARPAASLRAPRPRGGSGDRPGGVRAAPVVRCAVPGRGAWRTGSTPSRPSGPPRVPGPRRPTCWCWPRGPAPTRRPAVPGWCAGSTPWWVRGRCRVPRATCRSLESLRETPSRNAVLGYLAVVRGRPAEAESRLNRAWEPGEPPPGRRDRLPRGPAPRAAPPGPLSPARPGDVGGPGHGAWPTRPRRPPSRPPPSVGWASRRSRGSRSRSRATGR